MNLIKAIRGFGGKKCCDISQEIIEQYSVDDVRRRSIV